MVHGAAAKRPGPEPEPEHAPAPEHPAAAAHGEPVAGAHGAAVDAAHEHARLSAALPADLQAQHVLVIDSALNAGDVKVHYEVVPPGVVEGVHMRVGAGTAPRLVSDHVATVRAIKRYEGFGGQMRRLLARIGEF